MNYPISQRAIDYVRKNATAVMRYTCRIERVAAPAYDDESLVASSGSRTVIYEGVCRLWELSGSSAVVLGDTDLILQTTNLSIPWDVPVLPRRNDQVVVTGAVSDFAVVGKRFEIQDSAKAGEMRATRRFTVTAMEQVG